jgi:mannose-6-phosphate isomerase-like protein (cupin superfamily)
MMLLAPLLLIAASMGQATAPTSKPDVVIWPHGVPPLGIKHKDNFGNHGLSITVHDKSGIAEVHQATADVMIVQSGEATLVYGGEVIDAHTTSPNEVRGTGIRNGTSMHIAAGDVVHLPAGMPHQWLLEPGKQITYLVVHVEEPTAVKP